MLEIVKMKKEHISQIAALEKECFKDPWSENMLLSELESEIAHYFVAQNEGSVLGYIGMYVTADIANITNVAVKKENRRCGIAGSLLKVLINEAKKQKLCFVTLEVRVGNSPAIALYTQMGFKEEGRRKGYYRDNNEDALIMTLNI